MSIASSMSGLAKGGHKSIAGQADEVRSAAPAEQPEAGDGHTQLHDNGDGTFRTVMPGGAKTDHPELGHALAHIGREHDPDNLDQLKESFDRFLTEEKPEGGNEQGSEADEIKNEGASLFA